MDTTDFDYRLPKEYIAQEPMNPREQANLMVVHRATGKLEHKKIADFPSLLHPSDVLVLNNTKVFRARLHGKLKRPGLPERTGELFLVRPMEHSASHESVWQAIGKPGKAFSTNTRVEITQNFWGEVVEKHEDGTFTILFPFSVDEVILHANTVGDIPIPPYIKKIPDANEYQTTYAKVTGSVAAPTAGFHLTTNILKQITEKGVTVVELTLHVGLGTFLPIKTTTIQNHTMHTEWVEISKETAAIITRAKEQKRRIIAIGTTTTRALEGATQGNETHQLTEFKGDVNLFITPGFTFHMIDGLLTNFHLPKSTLLLLVSAFAGTELTKKAYQEAINKKYRFYSFGDAMLIL